MSPQAQSNPQLHVAIDAVRCASGVCRAVQGTLVRADTLRKKDASPVTVADFASQAVVCRYLEEAFPDDAVVGEENSAALRADAQAGVRQVVRDHVATALGEAVEEDQVLRWIDRGVVESFDGLDRYWTLDPIDGTKGFLRGGQYAVALGLIERGQVVLGVLGCPNLRDGQGVLLAAERGCGAAVYSWDAGATAGESVRVDEITNPKESRLCESVESGHSSHGKAARIAAELGIARESIRIDSQAKYATVACGEASIYLRLPVRRDYREMIWDHAAGVIAVEEAGGRVTDLDGQPLDFSRGRRLEANRGVIATNGPIHAAVLDAVARVSGP